MKQRRMGRTGLKVSEICLGTMTFAGQSDETTSFRILDVATERGVTFIDTADAYPIPPIPRRPAGPKRSSATGWLRPGRRDQLIIATKCRIRVGVGPNDQGLSRRHILAACEASLRRLRTDYIDLYQAHLPDPETPIDETLRAFDDLVRSGKVRYAGCSNYPAWQLALALGTSEKHGWSRYDCVQPRYNVLYREIETELLPLCRDQGVGVIVYNPLAGGLLTGKHAGDAAARARNAVYPGRIGRALSRPLLAQGPVRGRRDVEGLLPAPRLEPGDRERGLGVTTAGNHLGDRRGQPARAARGDPGGHRACL